MEKNLVSELKAKVENHVISSENCLPDIIEEKVVAWQDSAGEKTMGIARTKRFIRLKNVLLTPPRRL
ncbi:MAG: hypothetical protein K1X61_15645 [Chitinophagales bacterium]|nr:hypothetical protein [Chitinophagales bacterium]